MSPLQEAQHEMLYSIGAIHGYNVKIATAAMCDLMILHYKSLMFAVSVPDPHKMEKEVYTHSTDQFNKTLATLFAAATPTLSIKSREEIIKIASQIIVMKTIPQSRIKY